MSRRSQLERDLEEAEQSLSDDARLAIHYASRGVGIKTALAIAYIAGFQEGAERPEEAGDGDAMGQRFREWIAAHLREAES